MLQTTAYDYDTGAAGSAALRAEALAGAAGGAAGPPRRVLFVGNSLTYCNDLDCQAFLTTVL